MRKVLSDFSNKVTCSVHRTFKFDLHLKPYARLSIMQHLKHSDIEGRLMFAKWIKFTNTDIVHDILFSDETHSYLTGIVNKTNACYLGSEKPIFNLKNLYMVKKKQFVRRGNWTFLRWK